MAANTLWVIFLTFFAIGLFGELSNHSEKTGHLIDAAIPWLQAKIKLKEYDDDDLSSIEQRAAIEGGAVTTRTIFVAIALSAVAGWTTQLPLQYLIYGIAAIILFSIPLAVELIFGSTASHIAAIMVEFRREQRKAKEKMVSQLEEEKTPIALSSSETVTAHGTARASEQPAELLKPADTVAAKNGVHQ